MTGCLYKILRFSLLLILFISNIICFGQQNIIGENTENELINLVSGKVDSLFESDFLLKNGKKYKFGFFRVKGHPYFNTDQWASGSLVLNEKKYSNIMLLYDIFNDKLVCKVTSKNNEEIPLELNCLNVNKFCIGEHVFGNCSFLPALPQKGFYEIIYKSGSLQVYSKWYKAFVYYATPEYLGLFDKQKQEFFIYKNEKLNRINSIRDLFALYNENKSKIKSYIRKYNLKLFKSENQELGKFFQYLDNLK